MRNCSLNFFLRAGALVGIVYFLTRGLDQDAACFINGAAAGIYIVLMLTGLYARSHTDNPYPLRAWKRRLWARLQR